MSKTELIRLGGMLSLWTATFFCVASAGASDASSRDSTSGRHFDSGRIFDHPEALAARGPRTRSLVSAELPVSIEINVGSQAPARVTAEFDQKRQWFEANVRAARARSHSPIIHISKSGRDKDLTVVDYIHDADLTLTHYLAVSPNDPASWAILTSTREGRYVGTVKIDGELYRLVPDDGSYLLAEGIDDTKVSVERRDPVGAVAERRNTQLVELSLRRVDRYRRLRGDVNTVFIAGGDLGRVQSAAELGAYFHSIERVLGTGNFGEVRHSHSMTLEDEVTYYGYQYVNGIGGLDGRLMVKVDKASGRVRSVSGSVIDEGSLIRGDEYVDSRSVVSAIEKIIDRDRPGSEVRFLEGPELAWRHTEEGPVVVWSGTFRIGTGSATFTVTANTVTGALTYASEEMPGQRNAVCDAQGDDIPECDPKFAEAPGDRPWIVYEDQDNDPQCNDSNALVPSSWCTKDEYLIPRDVGNEIEFFGESVLGNNCCDLSGGFVHIIVNADWTGRDPNAGAVWNPTTENIYIKDVYAARSADVVFHEHMHGLIQKRAGGKDALIIRDYGSDSVAAAINEGLADAGVAIREGSWVSLYDDYVGAGTVDATVERYIADHDPTRDPHENGEIITHLFYRLASLPGGSNANAKKILLKSLEFLNKEADGNPFSWSYEDLRLAMREGVAGDQALLDLIQEAFDVVAAPPPGGGGGGGGCALTEAVDVRATVLQTCYSGATLYSTSWTDLCPAASDFYEIWLEWTVPDQGTEYGGVTTVPSEDIWILNGSGKLRINTCNSIYCSGLSSDYALLVDECPY